jgi:hypothetical protein
MQPGAAGSRPRPPTDAPLAEPPRSPDSQRHSGYALLPSRNILILIDARLSSCLPRSNAACLVRQRRPLTDQSVAHAMQHLDVELSLALERTNRIVGPVAASAIAAASRSSFFCALT